MAGKVIIYGGKGALGSVVVQHFKSANWWVASIDLLKNDEADCSLMLNKDDSLENHAKLVVDGLQNALGDSKVDAVINVAGGWAGGNVNNKDFLNNCELMWKQSVWSSTIAANISGTFLKEGGLLTLPGAQPALEGTPGMIGYGMAKAAVHQMTKSLAMENSGLPMGSAAICILPATLDTPANRKWMIKADVSTWTPLEFVAKTLMQWTMGDDRPPSGSLVKLVTNEGNTELVVE